MNAVRTTTKFAQSIVITVKDNFNAFGVLLLKIYLYVLTDEGLNDINKGNTKLIIVYQAKYERTNAYTLSLT
jgi:hypothetical protein